ncbi:hypothetical protein KDH_77840 [Dictyobacter sp. S3.2.2.5]|uniref:Uncharacterized protein n=1 Tax=Dictyobacter halimunensis TaxID=3026934 RepID=A0ABQ6G5X1_9CHLR|nr:hypothetical protein KDH_77840 [Dictyobacter sp. S3.2.2.5]
MQNIFLAACTFHQVVEVSTPVECLGIRNSAGYDKIYHQPDGTTTTERTYHQDLFGMLNASKESSLEQ